MLGRRGRVCRCPGPLPTTAGGNGRVQPFPRMRISFLPLSRDPEVSTQPQGSRPAGWWEPAGTWRAETPPTPSPGCSSRQDPPFPPPAWPGPRAAAQAGGGQLPAGTREPALGGAQDGDLRPFPSLLPYSFVPPPFAQPECAADIFGGKKQPGRAGSPGTTEPARPPCRVAQLGLAELQPPRLQFLGSQPRWEGLEVPLGLAT